MLSEKPWRIETVLLFALVLLTCLCLGGVANTVLHRVGAPGFQSQDDFGTLLIGTLCFQGVAWLLIPIFLRMHRMSWREAFCGRDLKRALVLAAQLAIVIVPATWLLQIASQTLLERLGVEPELQPTVSILGETTSNWLVAYLAFFAVVIAPVAEEFIFRGVLYPLIKQLGFPKLAWIGASFLFALIHANAGAFVSLFVLALMLTWLYEKTGTLLAPITTHMLFNATNLVQLFLLREHLPPQ